MTASQHQILLKLSLKSVALNLITSHPVSTPPSPTCKAYFIPQQNLHPKPNHKKQNGPKR